MVDELAASSALDDLFTRIDADNVEMTGDGSLIPELIKTTLDRGPQAEMTSPLGYAPGDRAVRVARSATNSRHGRYPKTVDTELGSIEVETPRDLSLIHI